MPNEALANDLPALPNVVLSEPDYRAFSDALNASARGRAFLNEYARRNRHANTEILLGAIDRMEGLVRSYTATSEADRIRQELRALLAALEAAKPAVDASSSALKAARLAALIAFVQHRIESIVGGRPILPAEVAALVMADDVLDVTRARIAVVPCDEEPELPIPAPANMDTPPIALVMTETAAAAPPPVHEPETRSEPEIAPTEPIAVAPEPAQAEPAPTRPTAAVMPMVDFIAPAPLRAMTIPPVIAEATPTESEATVSPPPCGEESGVGVVVEPQSLVSITATPLPSPPPTEGRSPPSSTGYGGRESAGFAALADIVLPKPEIVVSFTPLAPPAAPVPAEVAQPETIKPAPSEAVDEPPYETEAIMMIAPEMEMVTAIAVPVTTNEAVAESVIVETVVEAVTLVETVAAPAAMIDAPFEAEAAINAALEASMEAVPAPAAAEERATWVTPTLTVVSEAVSIETIMSATMVDDVALEAAAQALLASGVLAAETAEAPPPVAETPVAPEAFAVLLPEPVMPEATAEPILIAEVLAVAAVPQTPEAQPPEDPLALLMALSQEERIALFS